MNQYLSEWSDEDPQWYDQSDCNFSTDDEWDSEYDELLFGIFFRKL